MLPKRRKSHQIILQEPNKQNGYSMFQTGSKIRTTGWRDETGFGGMTAAGITVSRENHYEEERLKCNVQPEAVRRNNEAK